MLLLLQLPLTIISLVISEKPLKLKISLFHDEIYSGIIHSDIEIYHNEIDADYSNWKKKEFTQIPKRELIRAQKTTEKMEVKKIGTKERTPKAKFFFV